MINPDGSRNQDTTVRLVGYTGGMRLPARLKKYRFAVGGHAGIYSSVWFVSCNQQGCVYFGTVGLGGSMKVSLHKDGKAHVRHGNNPRLGEHAGTYITKWKRPETPADGIARVASICLVTDYLRAPPSKPERIPNLVMTRAPSGFGVDFGLFFSLAMTERVRAELKAFGQHCYWTELPNGEILHLAVTAVTWDPRSLPVPETWHNFDWIPFPAAFEELPASGIGEAIIGTEPLDGEPIQLVEVRGLKLSSTPPG